MTGERHDPSADKPPLHIKDNAERIPLYERLSAVLHNVRVQRLSEADTEELEAIKTVADADTAELKLPRVVSESSKKAGEPDEEPSRIEKREKGQRQEQKVRDAFRSLGRSPRR